MDVRPGLAAESLRRRCDPSRFDFETTDTLPELGEIIGQRRAVDAISFGLSIRHDGFNVFVAGTPGTGRHLLARRHVEDLASRSDTPSDWCYVNDFENPHEPKALELPAGRGRELRRDVESLLTELKSSIPAAFESDEYGARRQALEHQLEEKQQEASDELRREAESKGIALVRTPVGLVFAPAKDGDVISPEEFRKLPEDEQARVQAEVERLQEELRKSLRSLQGLRRELREQLRELDREVTGLAVGHLLEALREKHADLPDVVSHLERFEQDVLEHVQDFLPRGGESPHAARPPRAHPRLPQDDDPRLRRYHVNLLVDHAETEGAPFVIEDNPTHQNLVGRVEHVPEQGALVTDHNLIEPGALHLANGGYLLLDARKLLSKPHSWEALKVALRTDRIKIESLAEAFSLMSTVSLRPQPIPLEVKVVIIGERFVYHLLCEADPEFSQLFKVLGDLDDRMERTDETESLYARLLGTLAREEKLLPLSADAVARVVERGSRLAADAERLTTEFDAIADLVREADHRARARDRDAIGSDDVQRALEAQRDRSGRIRERALEQVVRETVLVDTTGEKVGQVNGLSVLSLGTMSFGRPTRITARVRLGSGKLVDIEREVELGGPLHSKGVLILQGYLGARYAADFPLSLGASLVFEQSYGGVDGDSASSTELYALLSAIAEVPLKQSFAITGSVNQHGEVQAIGGVNEKIEGFFDLCSARGLTGEQGVLIPRSNVKHLMLREDVVQAVSEGRFHVHAVETIDEGIEILTGRPAGEPDSGGRFPEGSVNRLVADKLRRLAETRRSFARAELPGGDEVSGGRSPEAGGSDSVRGAGRRAT